MLVVKCPEGNLKEFSKYSQMSQKRIYKISQGYKFGPYILDAEGDILLRDADKVTIRPKLLSVLLRLVEQPGELILKEQLLDEFWDEDLNEENVTQTISEIRAILGGGRYEYIETVTRKGYRFVANVKEVRQSDKEIDAEKLAIANIPFEEERVKNEPESNYQKVEENQTESPPRQDSLNKKLSLTIIAALVVVIVAAICFWILSRLNGKPVVEINPDGSWTFTVLPIEQGIKLETNGSKFEVLAGDIIEVIATGEVDIGRGPTNPHGEVGYEDRTMDSIYKDRVGGLEMWIGPDKESNRYFIGSYFNGQVAHSGIPTFRIIESLHGYGDGNNRGAFRVTIRKIINQEQR